MWEEQKRSVRFWRLALPLPLRCVAALLQCRGTFGVSVFPVPSPSLISPCFFSCQPKPDRLKSSGHHCPRCTYHCAWSPCVLCSLPPPPGRRWRSTPRRAGGRPQSHPRRSFIASSELPTQKQGSRSFIHSYSSHSICHLSHRASEKNGEKPSTRPCVAQGGGAPVGYQISLCSDSLALFATLQDSHRYFKPPRQS